MLKLACSLLAALLLMVLAACPNKKNATSLNGNNKMEAELRLPLDTDVPTLDPAHMVDVTSFAVGSQIFGRLVRFDENVNLKPDLAESIPVATDGGKLITFKLKKDIRFHNGRKCTAEDFVYSFTRLLDPETSSERGSLLFVVEGAKEYFYSRQFPATASYLLAGKFEDEGEPKNTLERLADTIDYVAFLEEVDTTEFKKAIESGMKRDPKSVPQSVIEFLQTNSSKVAPPQKVSGLNAPDAYTFEVKLAEPYGPFVDQMAMVNFSPIPKEAIAELADPDDFGRNPVGTGPFRLAKWDADRQIVLEAFDQPERAASKLSKVTYLIVPDRNTQFQMYASGDLDTCNVPTGQYNRLKNDPLYSEELKRVDLLAVQFFVLNLTKDPWREEVFQNKNALRQAVNYAIDRDYICDVVLEGRFRPFVGLIPPSMGDWTNPETKLRPKYYFDPGKAMELLAEAGHPQGLFLDRVNLTYNPQGDNPTIAQEIQGDLKNISVKVDLVPMEWATFIDAMESNRLAFHRLGWVYDFPDPDNLIFTLLHSSQRGASGNFAWYRNREVDKLIEEARTSFDRNKRRQLYWQIEQMVLEDAPWIFCFAQTNNVLIKPWVKGVKLSGMDTDASLPNADLTKVWIDEEARQSFPQKSATSPPEVGESITAQTQVDNERTSSDAQPIGSQK
ncbi:MAG: ABC transporter substrate-binding protein [bacterium]|jgi:ABC-type transport system substrate-binding protein